MMSSIVRVVRRAGASVVIFGALAAPASAIVGGAPDPSGEKSAVMILNEGGSFCTAIVVDQRTLLTAAHCIAGGRQMRIHWRGDDGAPVMRAPAGVAVHPEYTRDAVQRRRRSIDLGLVRLGEPLPGRFSPATLSSRARVEAGAAIIAAGFGPTTRGDAKSSGVMRRATLHATTPYGPSSILLWASSLSAGICPGDSGGAMFNGSGALTAIIAWGGTSGPSGCNGTAQGILLAPQRGWIDGVLGGWGAGARWE